MRIREIICERISWGQLHAIEKAADALWHQLGIDVEFSKHFLERANDPRNGKPITPDELVRLFKLEYYQHGREVAKLSAEQEAVMTDLFTRLNMPFVISGPNDQDVRRMKSKSVMRKDNFYTNDHKFIVV